VPDAEHSGGAAMLRPFASTHGWAPSGMRPVTPTATCSSSLLQVAGQAVIQARPPAPAGFLHTGRDGWPRHGVYFFFEDGQTRADGSGRMVRVGTHALRPTDKTTLWGRLRQYRGRTGGATRAAATTAHPSSAGMSAPRSSAESTCTQGCWTRGPAAGRTPNGHGQKTSLSKRSAPRPARCRSYGSPSPRGPMAAAAGHTSSATASHCSPAQPAAWTRPPQAGSAITPPARTSADQACGTPTTSTSITSCSSWISSRA
jgi:hypothetical protein